jgi:hypothetical protein
MQGSIAGDSRSGTRRDGTSIARLIALFCLAAGMQVVAPAGAAAMNSLSTGSQCNLSPGSTHGVTPTGQPCTIVDGPSGPEVKILPVGDVYDVSSTAPPRPPQPSQAPICTGYRCGLPSRLGGGGGQGGEVRGSGDPKQGGSAKPTKPASTKPKPLTKGQCRKLANGDFGIDIVLPSQKTLSEIRARMDAVLAEIRTQGELLDKALQERIRLSDELDKAQDDARDGLRLKLRAVGQHIAEMEAHARFQWGRVRSLSGVRESVLQTYRTEAKDALNRCIADYGKGAVYGP